jgi:tetratricopeptide (TPR) repeat protein
MKIATIAVLILLSFVFTDCSGSRVAAEREKARAMEDLGISLVRKGNLRGGLVHLREAVALDPKNADLHHSLALVYRDLGEYQLSLNHFNKCLELKPDFPEAQNNLGILYVRLREWGTAITWFQKAADNILYKTPHFAYHNIGSVYFHKGEYQKAIENYQLAIQSFPAYGEAYFNMACAYEAINRWEEAIFAYERTIDTYPEHPAAHLNLGKLYLKLSRKDEGEKELRMTIEVDPKGPFAREAKQVLKNYGLETVN